MNVQFDPQNLISMSGLDVEDCTATINIHNCEPFDVKFKFRVSNTCFNAVPKIGTLTPNKSKKIQIKYTAPKEKGKKPTDPKVQVHLLSLKDITDSENVFSEYDSEIEKRIFSFVFHKNVNPDDDFMFQTPKSSEVIEPLEGDAHFAAFVAGNVPWINKK